MRRGINNRKKKRIMLRKINSKSIKLLLFLVFVLIVCCVVYLFFIQNHFIKRNLEEETITLSTFNENIPFSIKKVILFSSVTAEATTVNQSVLNLDISQYCDIGIFLDELDEKNPSISSLYIDNIYITSPEIGSPFLYKKKIPDLGKCSFDKDSIINNRFDFNIVDSTDNLNYDNYEVYNSLSTPISLGFYNQNIKTNFLSDNTEISYNGTLLKEAMIPLSNLNCTVSFRINIVTNTNEHYICNASFEIPFNDENGSIYDTGYTIKELNTYQTNKFLRIK